MKKDKIDISHIKKIDSRISKDYPDKKPFPLKKILTSIIKAKPKAKGKF